MCLVGRRHITSILFLGKLCLESKTFVDILYATIGKDSVANPLMKAPQVNSPWYHGMSLSFVIPEPRGFERGEGAEVAVLKFKNLLVFASV